jgi:hypothetical protein
MKNTILKVVKQKEYDRYVFLTYENDEIVGLNFWQGLYEGSYDIVMNDKGYEPCIHLTDIYNRLKITYKEISEDERINKAIDLYTDAFIIQERNKNYISLPHEQKNIIREALNYYLDQYIKFNDLKTAESNWCVHDLNTLISLFKYSIKIELTDTDIKDFTAKNGIDLPIYNTKN